MDSRKNIILDPKTFGGCPSAVKLAEELMQLNDPKLVSGISRLLITVSRGIKRLLPLLREDVKHRESNKNTATEIGFLIFNDFYKGCLEKVKKYEKNSKYIRCVVCGMFKNHLRKINGIKSKWDNS